VSRYSVQFARSARKELQALPARIQDRLLEAIEALAEEPRPRGCKKLKGTAATYRIRVGDYRVVYDVDGDKILVLIVRVRHRKDAY
jgi:mRNA interferase RelE/StbE